VVPRERLPAGMCFHRPEGRSRLGESNTVMATIRRGSTKTGAVVWSTSQPIVLVNLNAPPPTPVPPPPVVTPPPPVVTPQPVVTPIPPPEVPFMPTMSFDASLALVDEIAKLWQRWHPAHPGCPQAHLQCDWGQLHLWFWRATTEGWSRDKCLRAFYAQEGQPYPNP